MKRKRTSVLKQPQQVASPSYRLEWQGWLLGAGLVLAPLIAGRLELGSDPVEPSLPGVISGLFSSGSMLPVAVWLVAGLVLGAVLLDWRRPLSSWDRVLLWAFWLSMGWLVWLAASNLLSAYPWGSWVVWSHWAVAVIGGWVLARQARSQALALLFAVGLGGTLAAAFALREYAENVRDVPNWRVFGTFFNPNFLAGYLCLTAPVTLALALAIPPSRRDWRWVSAVGACMQLVAILLTGSRFGVASSLLALGVMGGWMVWKRFWNRQRLLTFGAVVLVVGASSLFTARALTARVTPQAVQSGEHSGGFRVWTWRGTLRMVQAHPVFGAGLGSYELVYPRYAYVGFTRLAHNSYLQLAAEAGIPALVPLFSVLALLGWRALHTETLLRRRGVEPTENGFHLGVLRAGLAGAIAAGLARNVIDSDWYIFACLFTFWAVVGLLTALGEPSEPATSQPNRRPYLAQVIVLAGAGIILTLRMGGALYANSANWSLSQGMPDREGFLRALQWEPWNGDHALSLGLFYLGMARGGDRASLDQAEKWLRYSAQRVAYPKTWYHLGNLYRDLSGEPQQAVEAYRRALELEPHALRVMVELGKTLERLGRWQEAQAVYQRMVDLEGSVYNRVRAVPELPEVDYAFAYAGLARVGKRLGMPDQQVKALYQHALRLLETDETARRHNPMAQAMSRPPEREREVQALRQECEQALR